MKKNICVIFGGKSTEHDISILTACQVIKALDTSKYNIMPVLIGQNGFWYCGNQLADISFYKTYSTKKLKQVAILPHDNFLYKKTFGTFKKYFKIDCAVICCHGKNGEDGTLQGLLELSGVPYTSSGVLGSSVGLDKLAMKKLFLSQNLPVCKFVGLSKTMFKQHGTNFVLNNIELPVIVKPNTLGSSIGISVAKTEEELQQALNLAFMFDNNVVVEELVQNLIEVNISVLGEGENTVCSITEQPINSSEFLTFKDKYLGGAKQTTAKTSLAQNTSKTSIAQNIANNTAKQPAKNAAKQKGGKEAAAAGSKINGMQNLCRQVPANIPQNQIKKIEKLAQQAFTLLNCKGVVRIDFMLNSQTNKIYINEINTIPGSFAFYLWEHSGVKFNVLLDKLIQIAEYASKNQTQLTTTFNSSVLKSGTIKK